MKYQRIGNQIVLKLEAGDLVMENLRQLAKVEQIEAAEVSGIGAVRDARLAFYQKAEKTYLEESFPGNFEVLSLMGNLTINREQEHPHIHVVLGRDNFTTVGGHLIEMTTSVTLEIFIQIFAGRLERAYDEEIGLDLMDIE